MKGRVMRSTGLWYNVLGEDSNLYSCRARGKFRLDEIKESNPIAVGDYVIFDHDQKEGHITELLPRVNLIERKSVKKTGHSHVLAANVDQVMLIATLKQPRTSLGFIDRFLVSAEAYRIPQILVFNKRDTLNSSELEELDELLYLYSTINVTTQSISATADESLEEIQNILYGKTTLVAGHSGVGKSTLLNRLSDTIQQSVSEISDFSEKGTHTTTFAEMFQVNSSTFLIDTPGVKEWGLMDMNSQEISDYFPEMRERRLNCKFGSRCIHLTEPGCAILAAIESGDIALCRYQSYVSMVSADDNRR
ncbi:MAG TPA: ribosome small subunit-dependent GTPase A [Cyclobacteriaceae bacterium]|nr:ribosome small subunit-dependent GTPase A [Cyclobacteriaceae bacterium]HNP07756.1 ribosome small subunit-dependent GTPase A [Cyclobacteriaceae bacterium]